MASRTVWVAAAALLTAALAGCASGGNEVLRSQDANAVDQNIIDGRTTRSEVERIYGPPNATSFANAQTDIWIYRSVRSTAKAENFIPMSARLSVAVTSSEGIGHPVQRPECGRQALDAGQHRFHSQEPQLLIEPDTQCGANLDVAGAAAGERFVRCRPSASPPASTRSATPARRRRPRRWRPSSRVAGCAGSTISAAVPTGATRLISWLPRTAPSPWPAMEMPRHHRQKQSADIYGGQPARRAPDNLHIEAGQLHGDSPARN